MTSAHKPRVTVLGSFVADLTFLTATLPAWGQTVLGSGFRLGPGGKGSNQAVAAARLGAAVTFITKLGADPFGALARRTYETEGIDTQFCLEAPDEPTGAASVTVHEGRGENAIVVFPGSGLRLTADDVDRAEGRISESAVFATQFEVPMAAAERGLELAWRAGTITILNPAPAREMPDRLYALCDYLTPNESEAAALVGHPVVSRADADRAADCLLARGVRNVVITLGAGGALVKSSRGTTHVPAIDAGPVVETTGAGDAFNGGLAVGLAEGLDAVAATRLGCAAAGISVTRPGTALSMPARLEVERLLACRQPAVGPTSRLP